MNKAIMARMFTFTVKVSKFVGGSSLGDKETTSIDLLGYLYENVKQVTDSLGKEITSTAQVYLGGNDIVQVDNEDLITVGTMQTVEEEQVFTPILSDKSILKKEVYYLPGGVPGMGVIYLP